MKKIECYIPQHKFPQFQKALREFGVHGMTVMDVRGFGNEQTRPEPYLFLPKTKVEIFCQDEEVENVLATISSCCKTGKLGDGKIIIYPIEEVMRIRTGERGKVAI